MKPIFRKEDTTPYTRSTTMIDIRRMDWYSQWCTKPNVYFLPSSFCEYQIEWFNCLKNRPTQRKNTCKARSLGTSFSCLKWIVRTSCVKSDWMGWGTETKFSILFRRLWDNFLRVWSSRISLAYLGSKQPWFPMGSLPLDRLCHEIF